MVRRSIDVTSPLANTFRGASMSAIWRASV